MGLKSLQSAMFHCLHFVESNGPTRENPDPIFAITTSEKVKDYRKEKLYVRSYKKFQLYRIFYRLSDLKGSDVGQSSAFQTLLQKCDEDLKVATALLD